MVSDIVVGRARNRLAPDGRDLMRRNRIVGAAFQMRLQMLDRALLPAEGTENAGMPDRIRPTLGVEADAGIEGIRRRLQLAGKEVGQSEIVPCLGMIGLQFDGLAQRFGRLVQPFGVAQQNADIVPCVRVPAVDPDRGGIGFERFLPTAE